MHIAKAVEEFFDQVKKEQRMSPNSIWKVDMATVWTLMMKERFASHKEKSDYSPHAVIHMESSYTV